MWRNFMHPGWDEFEVLGELMLAAVAVSIPVVTLLLFLAN